MFADIVDLLGRKNAPGSYPNTFNVARLPYPPKLCWMRTEHPPPLSFKCHYTRLALLNDLIEERSRVLGLPTLDFSSMGTVWPAQPGVGIGPLSDPTAWRESNFNKMLHLNDERRLTCNQMLLAYFADLPVILA